MASKKIDTNTDIDLGQIATNYGNKITDYGNMITGNIEKLRKSLLDLEIQSKKEIGQGVLGFFSKLGPYGKQVGQQIQGTINNFEGFKSVDLWLKKTENSIGNWSQKTSKQLSDWGKKASTTVVKWADSAKKGLTNVSNLSQQYFKTRSQALDVYYEYEKQKIMLSTMNEEEKKKAIDDLDKDTDKKRKQLAREEAEANKNIAIFNAIINTAQAVAKAFAQGGFFGFAMAAIVAAQGAAEISLIRKQPLPALASGGIITSSGLALVGEQGPELVNLPQAASVIPLNCPQLSAAGFGGYSTANITLEIDGRTLVKQLGTPLRDMIRIKTGLK